MHSFRKSLGQRIEQGIGFGSFALVAGVSALLSAIMLVWSVVVGLAGGTDNLPIVGRLLVLGGILGVLGVWAGITRSILYVSDIIIVLSRRLVG